MFADPEKNLKQFGIREDMIVVDLGAGTGFYSIAAAKMVPNGKVYAIEVQKDYLITIQDKAKEAKLNNIECLWGNVEKIGGTKIGDKIADAVIISNILFQVEDKDKFIEEAKRILKQNGKVLLIDWLPEYLKLAIPKNKALDMFLNRGFIFDRDISAGEHHYGMILKRS